MSEMFTARRDVGLESGAREPETTLREAVSPGTSQAPAKSKELRAWGSSREFHGRIRREG